MSGIHDRGSSDYYSLSRPGGLFSTHTYTHTRSLIYTRKSSPSTHLSDLVSKSDTTLLHRGVVTRPSSEEQVVGSNTTC